MARRQAAPNVTARGSRHRMPPTTAITVALLLALLSGSTTKAEEWRTDGCTPACTAVLLRSRSFIYNLAPDRCR